ncbi:MAG: type II toxin-antitoxin system RelE/ParE family toxin [Polynucleobacter victoriensis]
MIKIIETFEFRRWLNSISDISTQIRLSRRLEKAQRGNLGDVVRLTSDVYEMREFFGPGWRMYYLEKGKAIIVMLIGGDKKSQSADIKFAKQMANELR